MAAMLHRHDSERALALALLGSLVLWNLPHAGLVFYPFKLLATWMHELSHGLVMMVVGAGFDHMEIYRDTSGLAFAHHGVIAPGRAAIAAAGYMGTPILGAALLLVGQTLRGVRAALVAVSAALAVSALVWIDNDFGVTAIAVGAAAFAVTAAVAGERTARFAVNFVAAQACANALLDVRVLFRANLVVNGEVMGASDAHSMASAAGGTPTLWAALWLTWSFAVLLGALRVVYVRDTRRARAATPEATANASAAPDAPDASAGDAADASAGDAA